jgi:hypothetical protein
MYQPYQGYIVDKAVDKRTDITASYFLSLSSYSGDEYFDYYLGITILKNK